MQKKNKIRRFELKIAGKKYKKRSVKLLFAISPCNSNDSTAVSFLEKEQVATRRDKEELKWTRVNVRWKGGMLKLPNGQKRKLVF